MRAMILAAGLGTRLRPLTLSRPKVLVPVLGTTVLEFWVSRLHQAGFEGVIVNGYHLAGRLAAYVAARPWPMDVQVSVEPILLGTAGGIRNVLDYFKGHPFLVVNGDVICDVSVKDLYDRHVNSGGGVSMLMHHMPAFNNVAVDSNSRILGFGPEAKELCRKQPDLRLLAYTGIQVLDPAVLEHLPVAQPGEILTTYRARISQCTPPRALFQPGVYWREMGSLAGYSDLNMELCRTWNPSLNPIPAGKEIRIHETALVEPGVRMKGMVVVGEGSIVMEGAQLENSIVWDGVRVKKGAALSDCVVADGVTVAGAHEKEAIIEDSL